MTRLIALMLTAAAVALPAQLAGATAINFDDGTAYAPVGAFYSAHGLNFTNASFSPNFAYAGSSGPLAIISTSGSFWMSASTAIVGTFADAKSAVSIRAVDVGYSGARIEAYDAMGRLLGADELFGVGVGADNFKDLSVASAGIKSFKLYQPLAAGGDGTLFDNLAFSGAAPSVPEPATWGLMIAGLGLAGASLRGRRRAPATSS